MFRFIRDFFTATKIVKNMRITRNSKAKRFGYEKDGVTKRYIY